MQSRYYNPTIGRFINADALVSTGQGVLGGNMFAYCNNNPINAIDNTGEFPIHIVMGAVMGAIAGAFSEYINGGSSWEVLISAVQGGVVGGLVAAFPNLAYGFITYEMIQTVLDCMYQGLSYAESLIVLGAFLLGEWALPSTGDAIADIALEATIGFAKSITASAVKTGVEKQNTTQVNHKNVTDSIICMCIIGGGLGRGLGAESTYFSSEGRLFLCVRI